MDESPITVLAYGNGGRGLEHVILAHQAAIQASCLVFNVTPLDSMLSTVAKPLLCLGASSSVGFRLTAIKLTVSTGMLRYDVPLVMELLEHSRRKYILPLSPYNAVRHLSERPLPYEVMAP